MSSSNCCFLTCIQVSQEADQVVWYSHLSQNFPQLIVIHTVKDFGIVNTAEIDVFLEFSCFFHDPVDVGNLISGSSAFSKTSFNKSLAAFNFIENKFVSLYCNSYHASMHLKKFNEIGEFSKFAGILSAALSQHHLSGFKAAQLEFLHLH